ncbi:unnamed protein product [Diamesa hyperborea]
MTTSLAEQLRRLQTPQSSMFFDSVKRDSILFSAKDAATKSRETIYDIGISGLEELITINPIFKDFESTLFERTARDLQRAVETKEVNTLLSKNIKKFIFHLSPYFMLASTHKCLEWLIRRFSINSFNKDELMMLILPYHQTNMFVRCIQIMKIKDPNDKWYFLADVQKSSSPLSKAAVFNHGAQNPQFLEFIGKFTMEAIKELGPKAGSLQTMMSFYCTTVIGALEYSKSITDSHILSIVRYVFKGFKSSVIDYTAAAYMITAQLLVKVKLTPKLLNEMIEKMTVSIHDSLSVNVILLLTLIFETQNDDLELSDQCLENFLAAKWIPSALGQIKREGTPVVAFYRGLIASSLIKIQEQDESSAEFKDLCKSLMTEVVLENEEASLIIRSILDSYIQETPKEVEDESMKEEENEVISLDSDDESVIVKDENVTLWYSNYLKTWERQYPEAFDEIVKHIMKGSQEMSNKKRNALKNVLGFLLKVSCSSNDANIFENLYHHNAHVRSEAVCYLVDNFSKINVSDQNGDILKLTISERMNDDNPEVIGEILKITPDQLVDLVGSDELVQQLSKILMRYMKNSKKWEKIAHKAISVLTSQCVWDGADKNNVFLAIIPFMFPLEAADMILVKLIVKSSYGKSNEFLKQLQKSVKSFDNITPSEMRSKVQELINKKQGIPSSDSLMKTVAGNFQVNKNVSATRIYFDFVILASSIESSKDASLGLQVMELLKEVLESSKCKLKFNEAEDLAMLRKNELPLQLFPLVLQKIVENTKFNKLTMDFEDQSDETKLKLVIFEMLVEKFFTSPLQERPMFNNVLKSYFSALFGDNHVEKILFFSSLCAGHSVDTEDGSPRISIEFQVRGMRLLNHILTQNQEFVKDYPKDLFQNIMIALSSTSTLIREFGLQLVETLSKQKVTACWKFLFEELTERKQEILMDAEQTPLIMFLISSKKGLKVTEKKNISTIVDNCIQRINDVKTFHYIAAQLMMILKHLTDKKVLETMSQVALKIFDSSKEGSVRLSDHQSTIIKLVLLKINQETTVPLWNLIIQSLKCHLLLEDEDGKYLTPSILVLKAFDEEIYAKLHANHKEEIFKEIVKCSFTDHPRITASASKLFAKIDVDCKMIKTKLAVMPNLSEIQEHPRKRKSIAKPEMNPLSTEEWKFGVALLELTQNKNKKLQNVHELVPALFDVLENCLRAPEQSPVEYTKQIVLSLLLKCCQRLSPDGKAHRSVLSDSVFKIEAVIRCIRETQNPQTHHHSLLLLAQLATMTPDQVLHDMMSIFTFIGSAIVRHDDSYSFQIISKIIENVIPTLVEGRKQNDEEIIPILRIFAAIALNVPEHRRQMLYKKLLETLGVGKYLWMFIAILMEAQVMNHEKDRVQKTKQPTDDIPQLLQIALTIAKEFEAKTIIESCTLMIMYLKDLPLVIEKQSENHMVISVDAVDKTIFSLDTHTDSQLRHFKYLVLQFLKYILSAPVVERKVTAMDEETLAEMKVSFQDIILNTLIYIPEVNKAFEMNRTKPAGKSWLTMLNISFEILESSISLLQPDMLLVVVENLLHHEFMMVRKKVLELLNKKMEENYFESCDAKKMLKLLKPLREILGTIASEETSTAAEVVQQLALISVKLLARRLADKNVEEFKEILELLTNVISQKKEIKSTVLVTLVLCIAELTADLKIQAIGMLGRFMPHILKLLIVQNDDPSSITLLYSTVSALLRIIETVPRFLSPYLAPMIQQLAKLSSGLKALSTGDAKINALVTRIGKIWTTLAQHVPARILIPTIDESYQKIMKNQNIKSVEPLMELLLAIFQHLDAKEFKSLQNELTDFFLRALQFRCDQNTAEDDDEDDEDVCDFDEINESEGFVIKAFVAMILKLSESSFRPLYENVFSWAVRETESSNERAITLYRLSNDISASLKSLFLLFTSDLVENASKLLDSCNVSKAGDEMCFQNVPEKNRYLIEYMLKTLTNIFLHDHQNFINAQRFELLMNPIVDQIDNQIVLESPELRKILTTCIAQFTVASSDDVLWKQLNYQVLLKTRADDPEVKMFGLNVCVEMAKKLGEDFEPLLPETIPFLAELLEDENYKVVDACQKAVQEMEKTLGESLQKYF